MYFERFERPLAEERSRAALLSFCKSGMLLGFVNSSFSNRWTHKRCFAVLKAAKNLASNVLVKPIPASYLTMKRDFVHERINWRPWTDENLGIPRDLRLIAQ